MRYEIIGKTMPALEVTFDAPGESVYTQSGGMTWMSDGVHMDSNMKGGFGKSLGRMFSGESLFMTTYQAERAGATVAFAATVAGEIVPVQIDTAHGLIAQKEAFLCAEPGVELSVAFAKRFSAGLFGGEGFILQDIHGSGHVFLEVDGDKVEKILAPGEVIKVDTGNVVAFEKTVAYEIEMIKGLKNMLLGGEGMFLTKLTGPGRVILQTQNFNEFAGRIIARIPSK